MDPSPDPVPRPAALPPHEQLGILAAAFQHDLANHASALIGLAQLLEMSPPTGREGGRLFAELLRSLDRFRTALAEFTRMRRALTLPMPVCGAAEAAAAMRDGFGGITFEATVAPDDPALTGDARWFAFLAATLAQAAGRPPAEAVFTARLVDAPAFAELRLVFDDPEPETVAVFAGKPLSAPLPPALAVAREILVRLAGSAEIVRQEGRPTLRLRFRHPRPGAR